MADPETFNVLKESLFALLLSVDNFGAAVFPSERGHVTAVWIGLSDGGREKYEAAKKLVSADAMKVGMFLGKDDGKKNEIKTASYEKGKTKFDLSMYFGVDVKNTLLKESFVGNGIVKDVAYGSLIPCLQISLVNDYPPDYAGENDACGQRD